MTDNPKSKIENRNYVIGLIGGIGSGKSRVAAAFARRGGRVIDADRIGHEALRQPELRARVVEAFGTEVLAPCGEVNRRQLAARVFGDPQRRRTLEAIVFPWIGKRIREEIEQAQADPAVRLIVLDAAVMLEAGWNNVCDRLIYVHAPRAVRLKRLAEQRGWNEKEVEARESAQLSLNEKASRADFVVDNSGLPELMESQVDALLRRLPGGSAVSNNP
jgi:dephospho-CoA kinase